MLFDTYYQSLGLYIFKVTESREAAEDIVQDTFIKVWEKRESLTEIRNFSNYLFILSRNRTLNYLRETAKARENHLIWSKEVLEESYVIDSPSRVEEYNQIVEKAISSLPPQQQKVYRLSRYERMKHEEIASLLGLSKETVKKHMQLALNCLKQNVRSQIDDAVLMVLLTPPLFF